MTSKGTGEPNRPGDAGRGDVAEEVTRLTEALAGWWTSVTAGPPTSGEDTGPQDASSDGMPDGDAHDGASCRVCPICRAMDVARAVRPDLLEKVALAAETVALLLREATVGGRPEPADAWATTDDADAAGRGTPIVVTDAEAPSTTGDEQEGRRAWG